MTPVVRTSRVVGDIRLVVRPRCMRPPRRKEPDTLTISVPYGKEVPRNLGAPRATRYRAPVPTAPPRQMRKKRATACSGYNHWACPSGLALPVDVRAQVLEPRVGHQGHDLCLRTQALADANRGDHVRAGRGSREESLLARKAPRHLLRLGRGDGLDAVHQGGVPEWRDVADPHPFDLVRPWL